MAVNTAGRLIGTDNYAQYKGTATVANIQTARNVPQVIKKNETIEVNANASPLLSMLETYLKQSFTIKGRTFFHVSGDKLFMAGTSSTTYTDSATGIVLTTGHGVRFKVFDVILVQRTQELMHITAISTDTLTVTRGFGSSTAAAIATLDFFKIVGSAFAEGSAKSQTRTREPNMVTGYTQIFRDGLDYTGNRMVQETYGGEGWKKDKSLAYEIHRRSIENGMLFGTGQSSSTYQLTAGIKKLITTNSQNFAGTAMSEVDWNNIMLVAFRKNRSSDLLCLNGENLMSTLNSYALDNIRFDPDDTMGGIDITSYRNQFGTLKLHLHGEMTGDAQGSAGPGPTGYGPEAAAFILNMKCLGLVKVEGRYMQEMKDIETPGDDKKEDGILTECGLYMEAEPRHYEIDGIPAAG